MSEDSHMPGVRRFEELSLAFWPPGSCLLYDGWVVGLSDGYTRRANCVFPLYPSTLEVGAKIEHCEGLYRAAGLASSFKMTETAQPAGLDGELQARGYHSGAETLVQIADLDGRAERVDTAIDRADACSNAWLDAYVALHALTPAQRASTAAILARIRARTCYAAIGGGGEALACGLCALDGQTAGLFAIAVRETHRRRGLGRALTGALMSWAAEHGGRDAFLQVMAENAPARALYVSLGFRGLYRYWYRSLPL